MLDTVQVLVGGYLDDGSVERLDPAKADAVWEDVAPMSTPRHGAGVAVLDNLLYAVGGHDESIHLSSVERLDPRVGKWEDVCPMLRPRTHPGTAVFDGHLYATGGKGASSSSFERYSPRANKWIKIPAMKTNRNIHIEEHLGWQWPRRSSVSRREDMMASSRLVVRFENIDPVKN
ncbi:kelch repeat protein [Cooperia oncophora]